MESVIDATAMPLQVSKLEGDAALFFSVGPATAERTQELATQPRGFI